MHLLSLGYFDIRATGELHKSVREDNGSGEAGNGERFDRTSAVCFCVSE